MCWYGPKALFIWLGQLLTPLEALLILLVSLAVFSLTLATHTLWIHALVAGLLIEGSLLLGALALTSRLSQIAMNMRHVSPGKSLNRALGECDLLA